MRARADHEGGYADEHRPSAPRGEPDDMPVVRTEFGGRREGGAEPGGLGQQRQRGDDRSLGVSVAKEAAERSAVARVHAGALIGVPRGGIGGSADLGTQELGDGGGGGVVEDQGGG